jgi:S-adenosylmethionine/arginine decarboxylase-like enzyme
MNKKFSPKNSKHYGKEVILDLHNCNSKKFNRKMIKAFFVELCDLIDMKRCKLSWWDDYGLPIEERQTEPHLKGTSAIQFILTSNITIHTLDLLERVYLNIFSCKDFDEKIVRDFSSKYFEGKVVNYQIIDRI